MEWSSFLSPFIPPDLGEQLQETVFAVTGALTLLLIAGVIALLGWLLAVLLSRAAQSLLSMTGLDGPAKRLASESPRGLLPLLADDPRHRDRRAPRSGAGPRALDRRAAPGCRAANSDLGARAPAGHSTGPHGKQALDRPLAPIRRPAESHPRA